MAYDRSLALACKYDTVREFADRQRQLDVAWHRHGGAASDFTTESGGLPSVPTPIPTPPGISGTLDTSFGIDGYNLTSPGVYDNLSSIAFQTDGKIVAGGFSSPGGNIFSFALARYNSDGSFDTSFGADGYNLTSPGVYDNIFVIAIQPDGKIVAGGSFSPDSNVLGLALARYNSDGSLDTSFGTDGYNLTTPGINDGIYTIALQSDGKIVVGGSCSLDNNVFSFVLARYNSDGSLDTTFGTDGYNLTTPGIYDTIYFIRIQSDGKIVAGGSFSSDGSIDNLVLTRYNSDGSLDTSFGTDGYNFTTPGTRGSIFSITLQSDGKIVAGGSCVTDTGTSGFLLARYNSDGSPDTSFATDGFSVVPVDTSDTIYSIALQSDGKIAAGGFFSPDGNNYSFALARYNSDGSLDTSFGTNGFILTTPGTDDGIYSIAIQSDGKIVAGGYCTDTSEVKFAIARYQ